MNCETVCSGEDRAEWLKHRRTGIGGSDAPAVLGLSPWKSPLELYVDKVTDSVEFDNDAMWFGRALEPIILARFGEVTKRTVARAGSLIRSKDRAWQLATLDGLQTSDRGQGVVEIKASSLEGRWDDGPPPYVLAQVHHQLAVTGLDYASIAVLLSGKAFAWYDVERDDSFMSELIEREEEFWFRVETRNPPEAGPGDKSAIARLFPSVADETPVVLDKMFCAVDERLVDLKAHEKTVKDEIAGLENKIRAAIGEHSGAILSTGIGYSLKLIQKKGYEVQPTSFRQLRRLAK